MRPVDIELLGLGERGLTTLRLLLQSADHLPIRIAALRDKDPDRVREAQEMVEAHPRLLPILPSPFPPPVNCNSSNCQIGLTYICTDWQSHTPLAVDAMRRGRHVAVEVPAALTLHDIRTLVETSRQTRRHCFMLENCCYDPAILNAIRRVRDGEIGQIVHAEGTYYHTLADRWTPWRLEMNRSMRGDLYPTHEFAPICMALGIHEGLDRLTTLVCMDSAPLTGPATYQHYMGHTAPDFQNGDHTVTLIRTERGRTILLRHDVLTEHAYERLFHIVGTKGTITVSDDGSQSHDALTKTMNESLITALAQGQPLDFDVNDMALWCAVTPLSSLSIHQGFSPVSFPQF